MNKHHFFTIVVLISSVWLLASNVSIVSADWLIDRSGTLVPVDGSILGDDDSTDEIEIETEAQDDDNDQDESTQRQTENQREAEKQRQEKSRETLKNQIEVRKTIQEKTGQRSKLEIKTEDGKYKLKQEIKDVNGRMLKKREIEVKDGEALHVEQENGETVRINAQKDGRLEMVKNRVKTNSDLDLQVGEKNEISVTLPNGKTKVVALPDKALERLVANGVIASTEGGSESQYELIAGKNGEPVYRVEGQVEKKLLGLFKLKFAQKMEVAAGSSDDGSVATGDIVETESQETSPWRRFLERMSSN